jgi:hypothetical protein
MPESDEGRFIGRWRASARELRRRGALGCLLMRAESGELVGLVRWPSDFVRSEALGRPGNPMPDGVIGWEARLTIEESLTSAPLPALGLAL